MPFLVILIWIVSTASAYAIAQAAADKLAGRGRLLRLGVPTLIMAIWIPATLLAQVYLLDTGGLMVFSR